MATKRKDTNVKSIEDGLRSTIAEMSDARNRLEAKLRDAEAEAQEWKAKYIDSGKWRKYAPTAIAALVIGFALGAALV
ncbi:MAG: hypothetical protein KF822_09525 [Steroidobacteraceae bacterium]|nr:hypothetical protein [Steroidobacteraceae bacterium]